MKLRQNALGLLALTTVIASTNWLGCSGGNNSGSMGDGLPATISITPNPTSLAVNSSTTFTAYTTNASGFVPGWSLGYSTTGNAGSLSSAAGGSTVYSAPAAPPVYAAQSGYTDGTIEITADVENTAGCDNVYAYAYITITAPAVTVGLSTTTPTVALGSTAIFNAYAVGSTNLGMTLQVNGVTGGSTTAGTIVPTPGYPNTYTYTAPANMPMTGSSVTITLISQADPTKTTSTAITLH